MIVESCWALALRCAAHEPAAQGKNSLSALLRHEYAALAPVGRSGLNAKLMPCYVWPVDAGSRPLRI
jgi:hypothetical protein